MNDPFRALLSGLSPTPMTPAYGPGAAMVRPPALPAPAYGPGAVPAPVAPALEGVDSPASVAMAAAPNPYLLALKSMTHARPAVAGTPNSPYHAQALEWMRQRGQTPLDPMLQNPYPMPTPVSTMTR